MNILYLLIPLAIGLGASFVYFFIWATKDGQFDDLDTPSMRLLIEDQDISETENIGKNYE